VRGVWPVSELRAAEAIRLRQVPDGALMAIAARALVVRAVAMLGFSYGARVVLLVGSGDNGADALYAGAELSRRGVAVSAVLADPAKAHGAGLAAFRRDGGRLSGADQVQQADLVIDGLLGIGATGALRPAMVALVDLAERLGAPVLAVDLPSGVDPDTGAVAGRAIRATATLCMGALKPGLLVGAGREHAGAVTVIDLGLELPEPALRQLDDDDLAAVLRPPGPRDDKYTRGVVGVVAGSARYPGAAELAVSSARLGGVGAVRYAGHAAAAVVQRFPETLVTETVAAAGRVQAWVIGPGLGDTPDAHTALEHVLGQDVPVVVDADGLSLLAKRRDLLAGRSAPTVLTPHAGEFVRFFGQFDADAVIADRIGVARSAAAEAGATVLLKGDATVVCTPDGRGYLNPTGSPWLATAGSGDVLSGLIGSLLATGVEPALAAATGAYLHGLAGSQAGQHGPPAALDLVGELRQLIGDFERLT
jgi:ADP-dependent NAD(P)H-hydrate dehydratase / NAD(P)H-hydrate epimerase